MQSLLVIIFSMREDNYFDPVHYMQSGLEAFNFLAIGLGGIEFSTKRHCWYYTQELPGNIL